jgi:hypothetical protein
MFKHYLNTLFLHFSQHDLGGIRALLLAWTLFVSLILYKKTQQHVIIKHKKLNKHIHL